MAAGGLSSAYCRQPLGPLHLIDLLQSAIDLFWFKYRITTGRDLNCNNWNLMNIKSQKLITFRGSRTMFRRMKVPIARYLFSRVLQGDPLLRKPFRKFSLKKIKSPISSVEDFFHESYFLLLIEYC